MKYAFVLLLVVSLTACGTNSLGSAAPGSTGTQQQSQTPPPSSPPPPTPAPQTYDMLAWMTMDPSLATSHHMSGNHNPIYTDVKSDRFFWTKTGQGFPWDIQLYDSKYIYLWVTELDWQNPSTFKVFHDPVLGDFNLPLVPRSACGSTA